MTDTSNDERPGPSGVTRRRLFYVLGAGGAGLVLSRLPGVGALGDALASRGPSMIAATAPGRWSDRATWGGAVPGPGTRVVVSNPVILDVDARVARLEIADGASLTFDPAASRELQVGGNVVVHGQLRMRPASAAVQHRLVLTGADEGRFQGGGHDILETDSGVWVMHHGMLDVAGTPRRAWARAAQTISAGATRVALAEPPTGWRVGDTVVITPTGPPSRDHHLAYDEATVAGVSGSTVTLSRPTRFEHPMVDVGGRRLGAEVMNLSRNVQIEGTPEGRIHVFFHCDHPQSIRHMALRHVGPRKGGHGILGRYGLHFHVPGAGEGSLVEGVVVRDAGNHAFVPHATRGATVRDCIAHHVMEEAFWWDPGPENRSYDSVFERCIASDVRAEVEGRGHRLTGFTLGRGTGNYVRDCVAVGVGGARTASGFSWPESIEQRDPGAEPIDKDAPIVTDGPRKVAGSEADRENGVWGFSNCVAHNNRYNGIFVWQNSKGTHLIDGYVGYHNGQSGTEHGAYRNRFQYVNSVLFANGGPSVILHANAAVPVPTTSFRNLRIDGAGLHDYLVTSERHPLPAMVPTQFRDCTFRGMGKAAFGLVNERFREPDVIDVVDCTFEGNEFWLGSGIHPGTVVRVQDARHGSLELRRADQTGRFEPRWNARVTQIARFDPDSLALTPDRYESAPTADQGGVKTRGSSGSGQAAPNPTQQGDGGRGRRQKS